MKHSILFILLILFFASCEEQEPALLESVFYGDALSAADRINPSLYYGVASPLKEVFLEEKFDNNQKGWFTGRANNKNARIENGKYVCSVDRNADVFTLNFPTFDNTRNYEIETSFTASNDFLDLAVAGLSLGYSNRNDIQKMVFSYVTNDGKFACGTYDNGWQPWLEPTLDDAVKEDEGKNKLTIRYYEGIFYFFANEKLIFQKQYTPPQGTEYGFVITEENVVSFDDFTIKYINF